MSHPTKGGFFVTSIKNNHRLFLNIILDFLDSLILINDCFNTHGFTMASLWDYYGITMVSTFKKTRKIFLIFILNTKGMFYFSL